MGSKDSEFFTTVQLKDDLHIPSNGKKSIEECVEHAKAQLGSDPRISRIVIMRSVAFVERASPPITIRSIDT